MAGSSGFNVNVPEPTTVQLEGNKTDVYERQQDRREKDRRMQSLSDLAGRLLEGKGQTDGVSGPDGSIRQSADTYERITEQLETFYETPQETAGGLEQKVDELNRRLEEAEAENRRAELNSPDTIEGIVLSYSPDGIIAEYHGMTLTTAKENTPEKNILGSVFKCIDHSSTLVSMPYEETENGRMFFGECEKGKYTITTDNDNNITAVCLEDMGLSATLKDFCVIE